MRQIKIKTESAGHKAGRTLTTAAGGAVLGACLMCLLDPARGKRRRALIRDKFIHAMHRTADAADTISRDMVNRARGVAAETRSMFKREEPTDDVIIERVRSRIGRVVSHPSAIDVRVHQGRVTLRGPILAHEVNDLIDIVSRVPGVKDVESRLEVYKRRGEISALQGGSQRPGDRSELLQENWAPAPRFLIGTFGTVMGALGAARRDIAGGIMALAGAAMALRAFTNMPVRRIVGIGAGRRAIDIHKTINIRKPVEEVFSFWQNYENFPRFMHNVREVRKLDQVRSRWKVLGPAGVPVEFDAVVTEFVPNKLIAWKTEAGDMPASSGIIRFDPNPDGSTRVDIRMSYNPPGGALGHAVATLFGADPRHEMDTDLARMKTLLETGHFPRDAARPVRVM